MQRASVRCADRRERSACPSQEIDDPEVNQKDKIRESWALAMVGGHVFQPCARPPEASAGLAVADRLRSSLATSPIEFVVIIRH